MTDLAPTLPAGVDLVAEVGGLSRLDVRGAHGTGAMHLQGAHVTSFRPAGGDEVIFVSSASRFEPGSAIRGGIPICFPWFGPRPDDDQAPMHGFARRMDWRLACVEVDDDGDIVLELRLRDDETTRTDWPHAFEARTTVRFGSALEVALEVRHTGEAGANPLTFEAALHTYLRIGDVRQLTLEGLRGRHYIDKVDAMRRKTEDAERLRIESEVDRVYQDTTDTVTLHDEALGRRIAVAKTGSRSTVVWNPWIDKAKRLSDMADDEWQRFVCIETANVGEHAVTLESGQSHRMSATITAIS